MSVTSNSISKLKQLFYNAGANSNDVSDAIDGLCSFDVALDCYGDNAKASYSPTVAVTLTGAKVCAGAADIIGNTAGNYITYTVNCNAVTAGTLNCEADLSANISAGTCQNVTVNSSNGSVAAHEVVLVTVLTEAAADSNVEQHVVLHFERA